MAGVDRQERTILGIDLAPEQGQTINVYAFDRTRHKQDSGAELDKLAKDGGGVPVNGFTVPLQQVDHFLDKAFRRVLVRSWRDRSAVTSLLIDVSDEPERPGIVASQ